MRGLSSFLLLPILLVAAGCKRGDPADRFSMALVEAARSDAGIRPEQVDEELVEKARRLQLVRRTTLDTFDRVKLLDALRGEAGPDRQYAVADRPRMQRERATRGLKSLLTGRCGARNDPRSLKERMTFLTQHIEGVPAEVDVAQAELRTALEGAIAVDLICDGGLAGVLLVERRGALRVVDLFPIAAPVDVDPSSPGMK